MLFNPGPFVDIHQAAVCICPAHASCHISIVCQGIIQLVAHHGILVSVRVLHRGQLVIYHVKGFFSIIIIRIDYRKRPVNQGTAAKHCMACAPRLYPALRHLVSIRNLIQLLVNIGHIHIFTDSVSNVNLKIFLNGLLDNEYDLFKSRFPGIKYGKINDDIPIGVHGVNLL